MGPDRGLSRTRRLKHNAAFQAAYRQGRKYIGQYMVLFRLVSPEASIRLGVVSSRKVGGAVQRNRARRRLREAFRLNRDAFTGTADVVLVARSAVLEAPWDKLVAELRALATRSEPARKDGLRP